MDDLLRPLGDVKTKKVKKVLRLLRDVGPSHPGLESHEYHSLKWPNKEDVWESYVEKPHAVSLAELAGTDLMPTR